MNRALKLFEHAVVFALIVMVSVLILLATVELGWIIVRDITTPPVALLEVYELLEIFGFVLLVLIGLELLETIKAYLVDHIVHVEIVLEVALIAIARKVIILDPQEYAPATLLSVAALIVTLAIAIFVQKHTRRSTLSRPNPDAVAHVDPTR